MQELPKQALQSKYSKLKEDYDKLSAQYHSCQLEMKELETKIKSYSQKDKQNRQLKSELADCKFQLKKIQEDVAMERTKGEMERIKFLKGYQNKIQELKDKIDSDNSTWIQRYDLREEEHKENQKILNQKYQKQVDDIRNNLKKEIQLKIQQTENRCRKQFGELEENYIQLQENYRNQQQKLLEQSQIRIRQEVKKITDKTNSELLKKQKQYEIRVSIIENEKRHEVHQHQNTKRQFVSVKDTLYEQIYQLTTHKDDLETQVKQFRTQIQQKTQRIINLNNSIKQLEVKYETQINSYVQNSKKNLQSIQNKTSGDIQQVLKNQLLYVQTMEYKIKCSYVLIQHYKISITIKSDNIKLNQKTLNHAMIKDHPKCRMQKLWKKEKQYEFLQDQIKWFKLQVNNKDDMYTKMFAGGFTTDLKSMTNQQDQRILTRSPIQRGQYKAKRIGRSLMMKRKDDSKTSYGSFPNSRGNN